MSTVTIAIPFIGNRDYLERAVESVLQQTYRAWRLILIGDAPDSETSDFANTLRDPRVDYIRHRTRRGLAARLNEAAALATTPFLARMDGDDIMFPERLSIQVSELERSQVDVVGSRAVAIDREDRILGLYREGPLPSEPHGYIKSNAYTHPTVIGRTDWFLRNPYREDLMRSQDKELWLRTAIDSSFIKIDEPLLFYRLPETRRLSLYHESCQADRRIVSLYGPRLVGRRKTAEYLAASVLKETLMTLFGRSRKYAEWLNTRRVTKVDDIGAWTLELERALGHRR